MVRWPLVALAVLGAFIVLSLAPAPSAEAQASNPVQNLKVTQTNNPDIIHVAWDAPASGTVYYYEVKWEGTSSSRARLDSLQRKYSIVGLRPGTYTVSVGVWLQGSRGFSNYVSSTITLGDSGDTQQPDTRQPDNAGENPRLSQTSLNSFRVDWDAASGNVLYYQVKWVGPTSGGTHRTNNTARSYAITTTPFPWGIHGVYVVSVRVWRLGDSDFSDYVSGTITVSDGRPENLTLTRLSDEAISVSWEPPIFPKEAPGFYRVGIDGPSGPPVHQALWLQPDVREHRVTGLDAETSYTVAVGAVERLTNNPGEPAILEVTTLPAPGAVADLSAEAIVKGLDVSWTARPDSEVVFWYEVQYTKDGGDYSASPSIQVHEGSSRDYRTSTAGQEHSVRVRVCGWSGILGDGEFCGDWSETTGTPEAAPRALLDAPSAPQNLQLSLTDGNRLKVSWDAPASGWEPAEMIAADSDYGFKYIVFLQNEEDAKTVWKRPGYKKRQVVFRNLKEGVTYEASVQARIRDAQRVKKDPEDHNSHWVKSDWVSATVTVPEQGEGGESSGTGIGTQLIRLVWIELQAGEPNAAQRGRRTDQAHTDQ